MCALGARWIGVETLVEVRVQQKCISCVAPCRANVSESLWSPGSSQWETWDRKQIGVVILPEQCLQVSPEWLLRANTVYYIFLAYTHPYCVPTIIHWSKHIEDCWPHILSCFRAIIYWVNNTKWVKHKAYRVHLCQVSITQKTQIWPSIREALTETHTDSHCQDDIGLLIEIRYRPVCVVHGLLPDHS